MNPVQVIEPRRFGDERGWFTETYNEATFAALGVTTHFVQDNHSLSRPAFTLRGLHFQVPPHAQDKLVRCLRGRIFDVQLDLRRGSPSYGQWQGVELSADNGRQVFIPTGFAHAFLTLEPDCEVAYKCSALYASESDQGIRWDSAGIDWPLPAGMAPVLSGKDRALPALDQFESPFAYDGHPFPPSG